jgi:hypothetical protein
MAALLYGGLHLTWYWQTPFGQVPVLDERENLDLAGLIAGGRLPAEPFYRAPGYPLFLSTGFFLGLPSGLMPFAATAAGLLLHGASAYIVGLCARRLFDDARAALISGLLYGLNPVLIHQATQILDGALANLGLLLGALSLISAIRDRRSPFFAALGASLAWSITALIRPQLLVVWLSFPLLWWLLMRGSPESARRLRLGGAALLISLLPLLLFGFFQSQHSGRFRIMPTQGPYNLWAANRPGAEGRYFVQTVHLPARTAHHNPTLVESRILYTRETGLPADNIDTVNAHWSRRLRESAFAHPAEFIGRAFRRLYYLFNDAEQYNNKTYAFHKARSPWLRVNPIGWGVVMLAGLSGLVILFTRNRRVASATLALGVVVTIAMVVAFVSDRFRLPLIAGASVMAGGMVLLPRAWSVWPKNHRRGLIGLWVCTALLTYSYAFDARSDVTVLQDHLLLAGAAVQTGDDALAWTEAGAALARAPNHPDALAWRVTSYFNQLLTRTALPANEVAWADAARHLLALPENGLPSVRVLAGLALWRAGEHASAEAVWRNLASQIADARIALAFAGLPPESAPPIPPGEAAADMGALARLAATASNEPDVSNIRQLIQQIFFPRP